MEGLGNILAGRMPEKKKKRGVNHILAARAQEISEATGVRFLWVLSWLKHHNWAAETAFRKFKDSTPKNKAALYIYLFKQAKAEGNEQVQKSN